MKFATRFAIIIVVTFLCMALADFIASHFTGVHQLATDSGNMPYTRWQEKFQTLIFIVGGISGLCSLAWLGLTGWIFEADSYDTPRWRRFWIVLAGVTLIANFAAPQFYSLVAGIKLNFAISGIFVLTFTVIGYWLLSIAVTPAAFKYVPPLSDLFR